MPFVTLIHRIYITDNLRGLFNKTFITITITYTHLKIIAIEEGNKKIFIVAIKFKNMAICAIAQTIISNCNPAFYWKAYCY